MSNLDLVNNPELKPNFAGDEHDGVCEDVGSYEVESERGDELREDVAGDALPLRLWAPGQEGSSCYGQRETTLLQVGGHFTLGCELVYGWSLCLNDSNPICWFSLFDFEPVQVWGVGSKLERGGGGPSEAPVQPASTLQKPDLSLDERVDGATIIEWPLWSISATSTLFAEAKFVFGRKNSWSGPSESAAWVEPWISWSWGSHFWCMSFKHRNISFVGNPLWLFSTSNPLLLLFEQAGHLHQVFHLAENHLGWNCSSSRTSANLLPGRTGTQLNGSCQETKQKYFLSKGNISRSLSKIFIERTKFN